MQKYNVLIMGAGKIAGDFDNPFDEVILTHAHAYKKHEHFNLEGFFDIDFSQADKMAKKWQVKAFSDFKSIENIDIVSICTPDEVHYDSLQQALSLNPKLVFLEKPVARSIEETKKILEISETTPILVNYSRRFVPDFQAIAHKINQGEFGEYISGNGFYGKGFIHNGSHILDLLNLLIGQKFHVDVLDSFVDFYNNDPTKTVVLFFQTGKKFFMQGVDCRNYTIFELDLIFEKARVRILDSGMKIEIYNVESSNLYAGYKNLALKEEICTELNKAMFYAVDNISNFLDKKASLICPVSKAIEALKYE